MEYLVVLIAGVAAWVVYEMANAPTVCETQKEAKWATENFVGLLTPDQVKELRDPQRLKKEIDNLGVRGWEYDDHLTCDQFITKIIKNYGH